MDAQTLEENTTSTNVTLYSSDRVAEKCVIATQTTALALQIARIVSPQETKSVRLIKTAWQHVVLCACGRHTFADHLYLAVVQQQVLLCVCLCECLCEHRPLLNVYKTTSHSVSIRSLEC